MGSRRFRTEVRGEFEVSEARLCDRPQMPGTFGWLNRFELVTTGEDAINVGNVSAYYVDGILDADGNWQADFPEPTIDGPTRF